MLETEIKRLSDNIEHLNKLLEAMAETSRQGTAQQPAETQPDTPKDVKPVEQSDAPADYTHDSLKAMALTIAKKDRARSKDIKGKLAEHDAKVMTDLSGDALRAVGEWLTDLKQEVGA